MLWKTFKHIKYKMYFWAPSPQIPMVPWAPRHLKIQHLLNVLNAFSQNTLNTLSKSILSEFWSLARGYLRELVRTHVILAPGACGREGQSAGSGTISSRSGGSADVCPSMVSFSFLKFFSQKTLNTLSKSILFEFWPPAQHPQARDQN